ncbi:two-component system, chemotaxis family, response regulator CheB [Caloranaerobacter azorensis DSM 13643]|uniref:Protein-glutamate methylesterase/protein-glutamine glutaminase n=1 Tax=Caloranaerobacter azorensis DSM 13643 TaxID=1121264 RepID=A0A1M5RL59_9FIRM|nr:chemotaxis response regulator protein-glutamate methylesterase [Caloranaerobacter azorensis]SHH26899.1 two-component system, chemotaxis family, response regulator CheB [Caloranaerobacter azorensis DSM 13643]
MIKVLVVDDSAFMRKIISDILVSDRMIEVIGTAKNGKEALDKIPHLNPDVITLDIEMPVMDGITALKEIMKKFKKPVIMLSSLTSQGAEATLRALEYGAVDFITKPTNIFKVGSRDKREEIIKKVKVAASAILSNTVVDKYAVFKKNSIVIDNKKEKLDYIVALGTSTGGPRALQSIIPNLPSEINAALVVVQHMPKGFTKSLANRLNSMSHLVVKEGEDGELVRRGYCYIAPGDYHMTLEEVGINKVYIRLNKEKPVSGHRPSVDVLMESVAKIKYLKKIGVILTGMGSDGSHGIKLIRENNGFTIAQDEKSCVVFGMPKAAINIGGINKILPLDSISDEILNILGVL